MSVLITPIAFLVTLGVLIVVHEFGHYLAARACGVRVLRFSVGFGRPLWARRFFPDGTEWVIAAFPIGGYVKMLDEHEGPVSPEALPQAFNRQPVWRRMVIVAAGPLANFLLALLIYWGLFLHGMPGLRPVIDAPAPGTPAAVAGLTKGDTLEVIAGEPVAVWDDVHWTLLSRLGRASQLEVWVRKADGRRAVYVLRIAADDGADQGRAFLTRLGLAPARFLQPRIGEVLPDSPAAAAGLQTGDWVVAVNGEPVDSWQALVEKIRRHPGQALTLRVLREGRNVEIVVTPRAETVQDERIGRIGASAYAFTTVRHGVLGALVAGARKTWDGAVLSVQLLWKMLWGEVSWRNLSGPVAIADYAGQTAQMGWLPWLLFLALLSVSLGVLNLLPVPVLDGGHLLYHVGEIITGRPPSEKILMLGQRIGMALLFTLMLFALYNDINRLLGP
ncbi:RIP metalloprotease RseP [Thiobacter aerophilum]|uniref:Zinc metalloprotease n=1 Tax=Thiobacter aerophilum TaxID=3121275 RepID=A0ABV0ED71_9BURK